MRSELGLGRVAIAIAVLSGWTIGAMPGPFRPGTTLAASCTGASHTLELADGTASPGSGAYGATFAFTVRYVDNADCPATSVVVTIPGIGSFQLTAVGPAPAGGTLYGVGVALPAGSWTYQFSASSGSRVGAQTATLTTVTPAVVNVAAPVTPPPTALPTAKPTPAPTAKPTPRPTPRPSPATTSDPTPTASPGPSESPSLGPGGATTGGPAEPSAPPDVLPVQGDKVVAARRSPNATVDGAGPLERPPREDVDSGLGTNSPASFGLPAGLPLLPAVAWSLSTLAGLAVFAVILRKRTLHGPAIQLAGIGTPLAPATSTLSDGHVSAASEPTEGDPLPPDDSSVGGPRSTGPTGPSVGRPPLRFDRPPGPGVERRIVTYRGVRVGAGPDAIRSVELGRLERGDEVEVLEWRAGTAFVRAPGGAQGWIHGVTILGDWAEPPVDD